MNTYGIERTSEKERDRPWTSQQQMHLGGMEPTGQIPYDSRRFTSNCCRFLRLQVAVTKWANVNRASEPVTILGHEVVESGVAPCRKQVYVHENRPS